MSRIEVEYVLCPFCNNPIEVNHIPSIYSEKHHGRNALGRGVSIHKSKEIIEVIEDCKCGKTMKEIQKALKEPPVNENKIRERYKEIMKLREELHGKS